MAANKTGIKGDVSLVTSGLTVTATRIKLPEFTVGTFDTPNLGLDPGDVMPDEFEDLIVVGEIEVEFEADESLDPADFLRKSFDTVITYPVPAGLTNGATDTHVAAKVTHFSQGSLAPNERRLGMIRIKPHDLPTQVAAS